MHPRLEPLARAVYALPLRIRAMTSVEIMIAISLPATTSLQHDSSASTCRGSMAIILTFGSGLATFRAIRMALPLGRRPLLRALLVLLLYGRKGSDYVGGSKAKSKGEYLGREVTATPDVYPFSDLSFTYRSFL